MDIQNILEQLRQQRSRLDDAIAALDGGHTARRRGPPTESKRITRSPAWTTQDVHRSQSENCSGTASTLG